MVNNCRSSEDHKDNEEDGNDQVYFISFSALLYSHFSSWDFFGLGCMRCMSIMVVFGLWM